MTSNMVYYIGDGAMRRGRVCRRRMGLGGGNNNNNSQHLLCIHYVPGIFKSVLHVITHLIFTTPL